MFRKCVSWALACADGQSFKQPSPAAVRGKGEPWSNCSILKPWNFFSEVQKRTLPFANHGGCYSCANKTDLGNRSTRKVSAKELATKWAIDCCTGKAPALCLVDPGGASLFFLAELTKASVWFHPLLRHQRCYPAKKENHPCLRSEFSNINSNSDCCLSQRLGVWKSHLGFLILKKRCFCRTLSLAEALTSLFSSWLSIFTKLAETCYVWDNNIFATHDSSEGRRKQIIKATRHKKMNCGHDFILW